MFDTDGEGLKMIEKTVCSIHTKLEELYLELVSGMQDQAASRKLIQLHLLCKSQPLPLHVDELRWAMVVDYRIDCPLTSIRQWQDSDYYVSDEEMMERRFKTLRCGLAIASVPVPRTLDGGWMAVVRKRWFVGVHPPVSQGRFR